MPAVQNYAKDKILSSLSEQYNAEWTIGDIHIDGFDEATATDILFRDQSGDTLLSADRLYIDIGVLSLLGKEIDIDVIEFEGAISNIYELPDGEMNFNFLLPQPQPTAQQKIAEQSASKPWSFHIDDIILSRSDISYKTGTQKLELKNEKFEIYLNTIDLQKQLIDANQIKITRADVDFNSRPSTEPSEPFTLPILGWEINSRELIIESSDVHFISGETAHKVKDIVIDIEDITYDKRGLALDIDNATLRYNDTLDITETSVQLLLDGDQLALQNLKLNTPSDQIESSSVQYNISTSAVSATDIDLYIDYSTIKAIQSLLPSNINIEKGSDITLNSKSVNYQNNTLAGKNIRLKYGEALQLAANINRLSFLPSGNVSIDANLNSLTADLKKVDRILKDVALPDSLNRYQKLDISGTVNGNLNDLLVNNLNIKVDNALTASLSGRVENLSNNKELQLDVNIKSLMSEVNQLPLPQIEGVAIDSLGKLLYTGQIKGTLSKLDINGQFTTDLGKLSADVALKIPDSISNIEYRGSIDLEKFEIGTLLQNGDLDQITLSTSIDGKGIDLNNLDTDINGKVKDFAYRGYTYADINLKAHISDSEIDGELNIDDENVKFDYNGKIKLSEGRSIFDFTANIDTINLAQLGLYGDSLSVSGKIESRFNLPLSQGETGQVTISNLNLSNPMEFFYSDTLNMLAKKANDSTFIDVRSDFLKMDIDGQYKIREIPSTFISIVDHYYPIDSLDRSSELVSDNIKIAGTLYTLQPLDVVLGQSFVQAKQLSIDITSETQSHQLNGTISMDSIYYQNNFSERVEITIASADDQLTVDVDGSNSIIAGADIPILSLDNTIANGAVRSTLNATDDDRLPKLQLSTNLQKTEDMITVSLENKLILNKKDWTANDDNKVEIYDGKILINNLILSDTKETLSISSIGTDGNDFEAEFNNFNIGQFATLMTSEPSKLSGEMNGSLELRDYNEDFYYLVDLNIDEIVYDSSFVGEFILQANEKKGSDRVNANFYLIGPNNDVSGGGYFNTASNDLDITVDVNSLQMMLLDPFMSSFMTDSKGTLSGTASMQGTTTNPLIDGSLTMDQVTTTIVANNSKYGIDKHTIQFDNNSIDIGTLDIFDKNNNTATLSGKIYHSFLDDIRLDISMDTDKFTFLNTAAKDNPIFYGKMVLAANADITGPISLLNVDVSAATLDNSAITISPFSATSAILEEDFIKYGKPDDYQDLTQQYLLQLSRKFPFKVNLLLDVTKKAKLNMIIDPVTRDKIEGIGNANLRIKLNPDSSQEIYGQYTVEEGSYSFSYGDFVNKKFAVKPGGTIRFNGDPLNALLDIDAVYSVYTTTYELIKNEISIDDSEIANAQKRTNVEVYLSMNGSLDSPQISLDIKVPDLEASNLVSAIDRKLNELRNDPNELNNQVFGLLLFNSFLLSESASSGFESFGSNLALSSISNLISNQLNKFADQLIKGVDVNLSVNSYDSNYANGGAGGNVTEIGLQVSKQLFNDRLSVTAGGNFDLAGNDGPSTYSSFIGDFVLEYKLTESGRYRIRVFSKSAYDRLLDENSNRNGVSLFFNKAFDSKTDGQ